MFLNLIGMSISALINILILGLVIFSFINIFKFDFNNKNIFLITSLINTLITIIIVYFIYKITCLKYKKISK